MKKWYSSILREIRKLGNRIFVYDPHGLLREPNFYKELSEKYKLHQYKNDGELFRFYHAHTTQPMIVFSRKSVQRGFIDQNLKRISIAPSDVFEELNSEMMRKIDVSYYQTIYNYYSELRSQGRIIDNTEDILLKSIWNIDIGQLFSLTENLKIALSYLVDQKEIPPVILEKVTDKLGEDLNSLRDESQFKEWIQEIIADYLKAKKEARVPKFDLSDSLLQYYLLKISIDHDFDIPVISIENIAEEKWLSKYRKSSDTHVIIEKIRSQVSLIQEHLREMAGKEFDLNELDALLKLSRLFCETIYQIQSRDLKMEDFIDLDWAHNEFDKVMRMLVNEKDNKYESLFYYPHSKPRTVDKILGYIQQNYKEKNVALIVFDGMSYDEWFILKESLSEFDIEESEVFALVPTITSFSRTAIFSGKTPREFMEDNKPPNETKIFYGSAVEYGYKEDDVLFGRIDLTNNVVRSGGQDIDFNHLKSYELLGLICSLFDDLSHEDVHTLSLKSNLYKKIKNEIDSSQLIDFLAQLKSDGYLIVITSDHGNIFCKGNGIKPNRNLEFDKRESARCLIFDRESFADNIINNNPYRTFRYHNAFLPENLVFVIARTNECFTGEKDYRITHGGISPEELVVPLVVLK